MEWEEIPNFPQLVLPEAPLMPDAVLEVPRASLPSYKPLVVPPSNLRPPVGIEEINGQWFTKFIVGPVFTDTTDDGVVTTAADNEAAYKAGVDATAANSVRQTRDTKLSESDWTQLTDTQLSESVAAEWTTYRQALRDLPNTDGFPHEVAWPDQPN